MMPTTQDRQGAGKPVKDGRGGRGSAGGGGRQREEGTPIRENPWV